MPTVRRYTDGSGLYLRANIDGNFVTLQLSPAAEGLLCDLGYGDEDDVTWQLLAPLCERGHVYTNKSGTSVSEETVEAETAAVTADLPPEERRKLDAFLDRNTPDDAAAGEAGDDRGDDDRERLESELGSGTRGFLKRWCPTEDEYEATLNRLSRLDDVRPLVESLRHHGTEHPMQPNRFRITSRGAPTYSFETDGIPWAVYDYRRLDATTVDLFFEIRPGAAASQSITIDGGISEWHTDGERFSPSQIDDLVAVFPDVSFYVHQLISGPPLGSLAGNETATIPDGDAEFVAALDEIDSITPEEYGRVLGVPVSLGGKGYGRIRTHTGNTFPYSEDEFEDDVEVGDPVSLEVMRHRGSVYACDIRSEDDGPSMSRFLRSWPAWRDESTEAVRDRWRDREWDDDPDLTARRAGRDRGRNEESTSDDPATAVDGGAASDGTDSLDLVLRWADRCADGVESDLLERVDRARDRTLRSLSEFRPHPHVERLRGVTDEGALEYEFDIDDWRGAVTGLDYRPSDLRGDGSAERPDFELAISPSDDDATHRVAIAGGEIRDWEIDREAAAADESSVESISERASLLHVVERTVLAREIYEAIPEYLGGLSGARTRNLGSVPDGELLFARVDYVSNSGNPFAESADGSEIMLDRGQEGERYLARKSGTGRRVEVIAPVEPNLRWTYRRFVLQDHEQ